ncbi:MAG: metallophosphoesterase [Treponema sp.]|jgi:DNA repair exonuclease SbcCD nuclease subunit|nr:metallophosphoesterase [Treponema sp.]
MVPLSMQSIDTPRRLAIGDIHGKPFWKHYVKENYTAFYFTGDYFDSHNPSAGFREQYKNFLEICKAARADERIKLCLGNHDYHYLNGVTDNYSGFQESRYEKINMILEKNIGLLKVVYDAGDNYIVSHAGITKTFLASISASNPEEINGAFLKDRGILAFNGEDMYGDNVTQSPIWVRPRSLKADPLEGCNQIVGHTPFKRILETEINGNKNKIVFIDTGDAESIYRF